MIHVGETLNTNLEDLNLRTVSWRPCSGYGLVGYLALKYFSKINHFVLSLGGGGGGGWGNTNIYINNRKYTNRLHLTQQSV